MLSWAGAWAQAHTAACSGGLHHCALASASAAVNSHHSIRPTWILAALHSCSTAVPLRRLPLARIFDVLSQTLHAGGTFDTCTPCGPGQISPPGSPSRLFCECRAGSGLNSTGACCTCPIGTYSHPEHKHGSDHQDSYEDSDDRYDYYTGASHPGTRAGAQPCIDCPGSSTTRFEGSTSVKDCICDPGGSAPISG